MRALFTLTRRLWRARGVLVMVLFRAKSSVRTESQRALLRLSDWPVDSNDCGAISISNWTKCTADKVKPNLSSPPHTSVGMSMLAPLSTRRLSCLNPHRRSSAARLQWKSWHRDRIGPTGGGSGVSITGSSTKQSAYRPLPSKTCS